VELTQLIQTGKLCDQKDGLVVSNQRRTMWENDFVQLKNGWKKA
jgi:hypothetical protein